MDDEDSGRIGPERDPKVISLDERREDHPARNSSEYSLPRDPLLESVLEHEADLTLWLRQCPVNRAAIFELIQDVCVAVLQDSAHGVSPAEVRAYTFEVAHAVVVRHIRSSGYVPPEALPDVPKGQTPEERQIEDGRRWDAFMQSLEPLPRRVWALRMIHQKRTPAISRALKLPSKQVEQILVSLSLRWASVLAEPAPPEGGEPPRTGKGTLVLRLVPNR